MICGFTARMTRSGLTSGKSEAAATAWASPLKLFEYMAAGKAIVAPDQANLREVLTHERDALLFAEGGMAAAITRLANDPVLRRELGAAARATVEQVPYTWDGNAARVVELAAGCRQGVPA